MTKPNESNVNIFENKNEKKEIYYPTIYTNDLNVSTKIKETETEQEKKENIQFINKNDILETEEYQKLHASIPIDKKIIFLFSSRDENNSFVNKITLHLSNTTCQKHEVKLVDSNEMVKCYIVSLPIYSTEIIFNLHLHENAIYKSNTFQITPNANNFIFNIDFMPKCFWFCSSKSLLKKNRIQMLINSMLFGHLFNQILVFFLMT